jgi:DNA-binding LacI/PurR family transcriptional regulator
MAEKMKADVTKKVTLGDVARVAGVSPMTVSNVVSGKHALVKLGTRQKVEAAIAQLKYRPIQSARNLRSSRANSIGILISDTNPAFLADPFISRIVSGISNYLSQLNFTLDVQGTLPDRFEDASILRKASNDALCAILSGHQRLRRRHLEQLVRLGQPVVVFQEHTMPKDAEDLCLISQNDFEGGLLLGRHLISKGVSSILFVKPTRNWVAIEQREKGLFAAIAEQRAKIQIEVIMAPSENFIDVLNVVKNRLSRDIPSAIAGGTDLIAAAAMKACEYCGISIPESILVTGFNGFDVWRYTTPSLTTIMSPAYELGRRAGEVLYARLSEGQFQENRIVLPVSMQLGASTER